MHFQAPAIKHNIMVKFQNGAKFMIYQCNNVAAMKFGLETKTN